ncbi:nucleolar protein 8 isoform X2 [Megalops cyprinoides]|uniref:nucleolar protein 8 isoform X2 n=1 Tax=Megalops cyprinoides TaxID=118141 RepID=UPI00186568BC|nr:nucleolar protein 8 isoform X2 [Megalops cyprinoides]
MKRLYIGGLGHAISQKDLKDRFGKFGEVLDVEIVTRKDGTGMPMKTFGYININISDADLKKCMTVLNKSKWKGGTLQIEIAKESFLHRLAQERQQATEKSQSPRVEHKDKLMESFKKAGVENFHMKAAVPGTEIPGHKDWVVSKFGRVLPVLHLKGHGKNKVFKYDPSKHSHNIKKLENTTEVPAQTPVSQLTWEILEGNDEISKKRRGEFPPQKARPAKMRKDLPCKKLENSHSEVKYNGQDKESHDIHEKNRVISRKVSQGASTLIMQNMSGQNGPISDKQNRTQKRLDKSVCVFDSEPDSDDEIRMLVAQENAQSRNMSAEDEDNLEVVGDDFVVKTSMFWASQKSKGELVMRSSEDPDDGRDYDSADTDEILTQSKAPNIADKQQETEKSVLNNQNVDTSECMSKPGKSKRKTGSEVLPKESPCLTESSNDEASEGCEDSDLDYDTVMAHCQRLEISLADLAQLAKECSVAEGENNGDCQESDSQAVPGQTSEAPFSKGKDYVPLQAKKGNSPEEILAAILAEDSSDEESDSKKKKKRKKSSALSLPAFMGTKALSGAVSAVETGLSPKRKQGEGECEATESVKKQKVAHTASSDFSASEDESNTVVSKLPPFKGLNSLSLPKDEKTKRTDSDILEKSNKSESTESDSDSSSSGGEDLDELAEDPKRHSDVAGKTDMSAPKERLPLNLSETLNAESSSPGAKTLSAKEVEVEKKVAPKDSKSASSQQPQNNTESLKQPSHKTAGLENALKQQQDNQKRLAAMEQRQKEAEQQKKLIQGALSTLDTPVASKGKHIVFEWDDESEGEAEHSAAGPGDSRVNLFEKGSESSSESSSEEGPGTGETQELRVKEFQKQGGGKLFDSSEDEEEDDGERFHIKPQFEGKAGQKLMQLQSRFGTDERFRMDSRFLESDDESNIPEETAAHSGVEVQLEEEKKKNLDILQSLLNIDVRSAATSKETTKSKAFRDISALHYDPTREEHSAFETKCEEPKKERLRDARSERKQRSSLRCPKRSSMMWLWT